MASDPAEAPLTGQAGVVRQFNRFYTQQFGLLGRSYLGTQYSVTQARVLYELGRNPGPAASQLAERIAVDPGYLSRLLSAFEREGRPSERRLRVHRPALRARRAASPAAGRPVGARVRVRAAAGQGVRRIRAYAWLQKTRPLDERCSSRGGAAVRRRRVPDRGG